VSDVSGVVKSIRDVMRQDAGVSGDAQRLEQLGWMFFLKIFDDRELEVELLDRSYVSPIIAEYRWRNWAANPEGITGDELLSFLDQLFPTLKGLSQIEPGNKRALVVSEVFDDAYNYMKSGNLIRQVVNKIQEIDFNKASDRHLFGDLYENLLRELQNAGDAGEFYTPRPITQFMVDMVDPKLGQTIMDPATGTGGFLTCTIEHVRSKYVKTPDDEAILQSQIRGIEKKHLPHLLCMTNLLLHGIDVPSTVRHGNTLSRPLIDWGPGERVDVVVTNPPFGGTEEPGIEANFPTQFRTRETADLFLVLIMHLLKPGGHCAIVLPDGTMFGEGVKTKIKEQLLAECNLHTIIRLPKGVFKPYTDIKTNLLFFTKGEPTKTIWFYEHQYPEGYKSYSKTKPIRIEEFDAEKAWWENREESEISWSVPVEAIKAANYNLDMTNPNIVDLVHRDPAELLAEYKAVTARIASIRNELRAALENALTRTDT
jgi:type I restriction enzyme M protein